MTAIKKRKRIIRELCLRAGLEFSSVEHGRKHLKVHCREGIPLRRFNALGLAS
jgi:hypothetical protein